MSTDLSPTADFAAHVARLRSLPGHAEPSLRTFFERGSPIYIARAPGRLDIVGGIGDYSGSLVLELPIAEAAFAAVQVVKSPAIAIATLSGDANDSKSQPREKTITASEWLYLLRGHYRTARTYFAGDPGSAWAAYVAGSVLVLLQGCRTGFYGGLRILIDSRVPEGKGVSSSAAVEVATMRAVAAAIGYELSGEELARLCQVAENNVVGAPCGIMDQMTSAIGRENELLALRCQPATVEGLVPIPEEMAFWGIDSGVRHSVGGADYTSVRCGAFMGYRIIAEAAGLDMSALEPDSSVLEADDPTWKGYLANISPEEFQTRFSNVVPVALSGREFLQRYAGTTDCMTQVDADRTYAVRAPTLYPIETNQLAARLQTLLQSPITEQSLLEMGQLMYAAHDGYSACGLGSGATDLLVRLVREAGITAGLYGAKITGGGSGGAVAILGRSNAHDAIASIARRYTELSGRETYVFRGSSPGAYGTPVQQLVI
jgi:galactokinase